MYGASMALISSSVSRIWAPATVLETGEIKEQQKSRITHHIDPEVYLDWLCLRLVP